MQIFKKKSYTFAIVFGQSYNLEKIKIQIFSYDLKLNLW